MGKIQIRVSMEGNDVSIRLDDNGTILDIKEPIFYDAKVTPDNEIRCLVRDLRAFNEYGDIAGSIAEYLKDYVSWMYIERKKVSFTIVPVVSGDKARKEYAGVMIDRVIALLSLGETTSYTIN